MSSNSKYLNLKRSNVLSTFFTVQKFGIKDQAFFAKRLSFLIKSGMPVLDSIKLISDQTKTKVGVKIFESVASGVENGQTLAGSLEKFSKYFGNFTINVIRAGELSGTLTENLSYLADELKKKEALKKKILGAMLYPAIITLATVFITSFLVFYIFPKIIPIFKSLKAKLPLSTRIIIYITNIFNHYGLWIIIAIIVLFVSLTLLVNHSFKAKLVFDGLVLRTPFFGKTIKNYNLTNICRTLGLLLKSNMPLTEALIITSNTSENTRYKKVFIDIQKGVAQGKNMSLLIGQSPSLFPPMLGHMVAVGEKSGNLSNTLIYLSEYYENEFEDATKNLSNAIEPVLMVVMGVLVGFIAISIIMPIYGITQNLHV